MIVVDLYLRVMIINVITIILYNKIAFTAIQSDNHHNISSHNIKCFMEQND